VRCITKYWHKNWKWKYRVLVLILVRGTIIGKWQYMQVNTNILFSSSTTKKEYKSREWSRTEEVGSLVLVLVRYIFKKKKKKLNTYSCCDDGVATLCSISPYLCPISCLGHSLPWCVYLLLLPPAPGPWTMHQGWGCLVLVKVFLFCVVFDWE
jgi:hypothetical protein